MQENKRGEFMNIPQTINDLFANAHTTTLKPNTAQFIGFGCTIKDNEKQYRQHIIRECYKKFFYEIIKYLEQSTEENFTLTFSKETDRMIFEKEEKHHIQGTLYPGYVERVPLLFPSTKDVDETPHE